MAERMSESAVRARLRDVPVEVDDESEARPRSGRRVSELLLGALLMFGGALAGLIVLQRDEARITVVASSRDLPRGTVIARSDLVALEVSSMPSRAVTMAEEAAVLVGKRLVVDLPAGVPIPRFTVIDEPPLPSTHALIPLQLERGAVPTDLARGDLVQIVISFPNRGPDAPTPEILPETMNVVAVEAPDEYDDRVRVTVRASRDVAIDLARADRIQVMKVASE